MFNVGEPEFAANPEPRCPVVILPDVSGSMAGKPVKELNQGMRSLHDTLQNDAVAANRVEVSIITFGDIVQCVQDFSTVDGFQPPEFIADGGTPMGEALHLALDKVEQRKKEYRANGIQYFRPWIFLLTDGGPTDTWKDAAKRVRQGEADKRFIFFGVGVQGADMQTLSEVCPANRPPVMMKGLQFEKMFQWLSASLGRMAASQPGMDQVALPSIDGWGEVHS